MPFPKVRSGTAFEGIVPGHAPLIVTLAWVGVGTRELRTHPAAWPTLASLMRSGEGTLQGSTGSLPTDPAATLTTIGTGGLPAEHGVTGTVLRGADGRPTAAFGSDAPVTMIATLAEDLDDASGQAARVALVAAAPEDRGLIGGDWYLRADHDEVKIGSDAVRTVAELVAKGYGADAIPDVIGVTLRGRLGRMDHDTAEIVDSIRARVPDAVIAVAGTGSAAPMSATPAIEVNQELSGSLGVAVAEAVGTGGVFLGQTAAAAGSSSARVADALRSQTTIDGEPRFLDAYAGYAIELARYC